MNAGAYREPIEIQKSEYEKDEIGNQKECWETVYRGFAYVNNISGMEYWEAARTQSENTVMFHTRYHKRLEELDSKNCQIIWKGKAYNVNSIDNVQNKNEIVKFRAIKKG